MENLLQSARGFPKGMGFFWGRHDIARRPRQTFPLSGNGVSAYLDIDKVMRIAKESGADSIHPGYGFLAENPEFAKRCQEEGIIFIGPNVEMLELFGDKGRARLAAKNSKIPTN